MTAAAPVVSVVMPCHNEERTLPDCIEAARRGIEAAGIAGEVVVVDNAPAASDSQWPRLK